MKARRSMVVMALVTTLLTGCGGMGAASSGNGGAPSGGPSSAGSANVSSAAVTVQNGAFSAKSLAVKPGQAVKFIFDGMGTDRFVIVGVAKSPTVKPGQSWTYTFQKTGAFVVEMNDMTYIKMRVVVK